MEALDALRKTRLVDNFNGKEVSTAFLLDILDAARWAITFQGMQSWEVVVVKQKHRRQKLSEILKQGELKRASALLVIACNQERARFVKGELGDRLSLIECAALAQNVVVAARSHGVSCSINTEFDRDQMRDFIEAPAGIEPMMVVGLGHASGHPETKRAPLNTFLHTEKFGKPWEGELAEKYKTKSNQSTFMKIFG